MKNLTFHARWLLAAGAIASVILGTAEAQAQSPQPAATTDVQPVPPKLPYGVDDVLKLSQAKISDDIIINYINNSGTVYSLQPKDIVYLRNQGVSDQVLNVMVNQHTQVAMAAQAAAAQNAAAAAAAQNQVPAPAYAPAPVYDQPVAVEAPAAPQSTVYVIPNSAAYTGYSPSYGYSYPYYYGGYYGPVVSFGLGYCGPRYYGGYHGYYHGGYGGGWHGGYHGGGGHGASSWHGGGIHVASTGFRGAASPHSGGGVRVSSGGFHGAGGARGGGHR